MTSLVEIVTELAAIVKEGVHNSLAPRIEAVEAALREFRDPSEGPRMSLADCEEASASDRMQALVDALPDAGDPEPVSEPEPDPEPAVVDKPAPKSRVAPKPKPKPAKKR